MKSIQKKLFSNSVQERQVDSTRQKQYTVRPVHFMDKFTLGQLVLATVTKGGTLARRFSVLALERKG